MLPTGINLHSAWENYATAKSTGRRPPTPALALPLRDGERSVVKTCLLSEEKSLLPGGLKYLQFEPSARLLVTRTTAAGDSPKLVHPRCIPALVNSRKSKHVKRNRSEYARADKDHYMRRAYAHSRAKAAAHRVCVREQRHKLSTQYGSKRGGDKRLLSDEN